MSKRKFNLVCVAHPDDETLFFGGLILMNRKRPWKVVCATDANADGQGRKRRKQFERACELLGVEDVDWLGFRDLYEERVPIDALIEKLRAMASPSNVYTHGSVGEYGHPHHQDVSFATHQAFAHRSLKSSVSQPEVRVWASGYNAFPERSVQLNEQAFRTKSHILTSIYGSETMRFLNLLPATSSESFVSISERESKAIYEYLALSRKLRTGDLKVYQWLAPYLKKHRQIPRPF
jgi:LmbE family N-acetylglucosaminyl deacetylase